MDRTMHSKNKMIPFGMQRNEYDITHRNYIKFRHQTEAWFPSAFLTHIISNRSRVSSRAPEYVQASRENLRRPLDRDLHIPSL